MGRIRTKDIKDLARALHEAYTECLTTDFEQNKATINDTKLLAGKSKRFRNRVAGYTVCLAKQRARGITAVGERAQEPSEPVEVAETEAAEEPETEETKSETEETTEASESSEAAEEKEAVSETTEEKSE